MPRLIPKIGVMSGDTSIAPMTTAVLFAIKPMLAIKGRASFLGERSIGHLDPGARSSTLLIDAVCDVLAGTDHGG